MSRFSYPNYDHFYIFKTHPRDYDFKLLLKEVNLIIEYFEWWVKTYIKCDDPVDDEDYHQQYDDVRKLYLPTLETIRTFIITSDVIHTKNINFLKCVIIHVHWSVIHNQDFQYFLEKKNPYGDYSVVYEGIDNEDE